MRPAQLRDLNRLAPAVRGGCGVRVFDLGRFALGRSTTLRQVGDVAAEIREARAVDVGDLARVQVAAATEGYRSIFPPAAPKPTIRALRPSWQHLVDSSSTVVLVAAAPAPIGSVVVRDSAGVPSGRILERLYVDPRWWGCGVGSRLHDAGLTAASRDDATSINLWVLDANVRARSMYERRGWMLVDGHTLTHPVGVVEVLYELDLRRL